MNVAWAPAYAPTGSLATSGAVLGTLGETKCTELARIDEEVTP